MNSHNVPLGGQKQTSSPISKVADGQKCFVCGKRFGKSRSNRRRHLRHHRLSTAETNALDLGRDSIAFQEAQRNYQAFRMKHYGDRRKIYEQKILERYEGLLWKSSAVVERLSLSPSSIHFVLLTKSFTSPVSTVEERTLSIIEKATNLTFHIGGCVVNYENRKCPRLEMV